MIFIISNDVLITNIVLSECSPLAIRRRPTNDGTPNASRGLRESISIVFQSCEYSTNARHGSIIKCSRTDSTTSFRNVCSFPLLAGPHDHLNPRLADNCNNVHKVKSRQLDSESSGASLKGTGCFSHMGTPLTNLRERRR